MLVKEIQELLHVSSHTLRYYEKMGLLKPKRDQNGYRNYSQEDVLKIKKILFLRELDLSLDDIQKIINHEIEFQTVLKNHLKHLDQKISSLQYIKDICLDLKDQEIPLLDTIVEENVLANQQIDHQELKKCFEKVINYIKPLKTVVIGYRIDSNSFLGSLLFVIILSIVVGSGLAIGLPISIAYLNQQFINSNLKPLPTFTTNLTMTLIAIGICFILLMLMMAYHCGKQKYLELTENNISVCSLEYQSRWSILKGMISKNYYKGNLNYSYQDVIKVNISLLFNTLPAYRVGNYRTYNLHFYTLFNDGNKFEIDSGLYFGEKYQDAYRILVQKEVPIETTDEIISFLNQDELKMYDYFENIYHLNSSKSKKL